MKRQAGFTLIEMAVVVFLIGLLATMGISALKAQLASAAISATKKKQDTIKDALVSYLAMNRRLPCPAVDATGGLDASVRTATSPPNCTTYFGIVPYAELGLPKSAALDGWENFFTYAVSQKWTTTLNLNGCPYSDVGLNKTCTALKAFNVGNLGAITVNASTAVVVLISHGMNGAGAYTSKGTQNAPPTAATDEFTNMPPANLLATPPPNAPGLIQRDYTDNTSAQGGAFDDVVMVLNPSDLLTPLIKDGALQSAQSQYASQLVMIQDWIANYIASHGCSVPSASNLNLGLPQNLQVDPWGHTISASTPFAYSALLTYSSSSVAATFTISNSSSNSPLYSQTGARLGTIYPFLNFTNSGC